MRELKESGQVHKKHIDWKMRWHCGFFVSVGARRRKMEYDTARRQAGMGSVKNLQLMISGRFRGCAVRRHSGATEPRRWRTTE